MNIVGAGGTSFNLIWEVRQRQPSRSGIVKVQMLRVLDINQETMSSTASDSSKAGPRIGRGLPLVLL